MRCIPMVVQSYRDLIAWQKSMDLVTEVYRCTQAFPKQRLTDWFRSWGERQSRFPATLQKDMPDCPLASSGSF